MSADRWLPVAWPLWRYAHLTFPQIADRLRVLGVEVSPREVADAVMAHAAEQLDRHLGRR